MPGQHDSAAPPDGRAGAGAGAGTDARDATDNRARTGPEGDRAGRNRIGGAELGDVGPGDVGPGGAGLGRSGKIQGGDTALPGRLIPHMTRVFAQAGAPGDVRLDGVAALCDRVVLPAGPGADGRAQVLIAPRPRVPGQPLTIFLCAHRLVPALAAMVSLLPGLTEDFVLVSGSTDATLPHQTDARQPPFGPAERALVERILGHPHLRRWYAENLDRGGHPRLSPLPLGLVLPQGCPPGGIPRPAVPPLAQRPLQVLCAHRLRPGPQWEVRRRVDRLARGPWAGLVTRPEAELPEPAFLEAVAAHGFVLCATGGGLDPAPKAWTALLHGAIPIIRRNALTPAYRLLPVVIVPSWDADTLTAARLRVWRDRMAPWFDDTDRRAEVLRRLGQAFWWRLILSGAPPRRAPGAGPLALEVPGDPGIGPDTGPNTGAADRGAADRLAQEKMPRWVPERAGGQEADTPQPRRDDDTGATGRGGAVQSGPARTPNAIPNPDSRSERDPATDPLATPRGRAAAAAALGRGLAHLETLFGFGFARPDPDRLAARLAGRDCASPDRFHAVALSEVFDGFDPDRDELDGLAARIAAHVPPAPAVAAALRGAAARFGRPEAALLAEADAWLRMTPADPLDWAAAPAHVHAKVNHGLWEDLTHLGLVQAAAPGNPAAAARLAAFRGARAPYFETVLPQLRQVLAGRFLELFLAGLAGLDPNPQGPDRLDPPPLDPGLEGYRGAGSATSLGLSLMNGDIPHAEVVAGPLGPVARGALPGLLGMLSAMGDGATGRERAGGTWPVVDGGSMRQLVWGRRLAAFVAAATRGAEAVVFIVPGDLRRLALCDEGSGQPGGRAPAQHRILIPPTRAHEFWPVVMASVLGQAEAVMRRHGRVTVFLQAAALSVPLAAGLRALAQRGSPQRPGGCALRLFDMGQVLDTADPARLGSGQLTARRDLAAVVASQPMPFRLMPPLQAVR